ncbi:MAG: hypothetical protein V3U92_19525 [Cellulophaga sp.]
MKEATYYFIIPVLITLGVVVTLLPFLVGPKYVEEQFIATDYFTLNFGVVGQPNATELYINGAYLEGGEYGHGYCTKSVSKFIDNKGKTCGR